MRRAAALHGDRGGHVAHFQRGVDTANLAQIDIDVVRETRLETSRFNRDAVASRENSGETVVARTVRCLQSYVIAALVGQSYFRSRDDRARAVTDIAQDAAFGGLCLQ